MKNASILSQFTASLGEFQQNQALNKKVQKTTKHGLIAITVPQLDITQINLEASNYYWSAPEQGNYIAGFDIYESYTASGPQRLQQLDLHFQQYRDSCCLASDAAKTSDSPMAFCSFAFDENDDMSAAWEGFANSQLIVPSLIVHINQNRSQIIFNFKHSETNLEKKFSRLLNQIFISVSSPVIAEQTKVPEMARLSLTQTQQMSGNQAEHKQSWLAQVKKAILTINQGHLSKLVPSRHIRYQQKHGVSSNDLLHKLTDSYPACNILSIAQAKKRLVAASPEKLLKITTDQVSCDAIGGTLKRSDGQSIVNLLRHHTKSIDKLLHEHAIIVEHIYNVLDRYCEILKLPSAPGIMKLKHLIHLETHIEGKLKNPCSILNLAKELHPTPAVAGFPAEQAIQWLKQNEAHNRGLYSGAVGWLTPSGSGELSVILRCALVSPGSNDKVGTSNIDLYAGAGIVESSSPEEEWDETELKLETILDILK